VRKIAFIVGPSVILLLVVLLMPLVAAPPELGPAPAGLERDYWPTNSWIKTTPEEQGLDHAVLRAGTNYLREHYPNTTGFLVVRNGYLVWEEYIGGNTNFRTISSLRSVTKSITGTLIGIALQRGDIESLDQPLSDFFPEYFAANPSKSARGSTTIRELLTMQSGIEWDERRPPISFAPNTNVIDEMLALPQTAPPGEEYRYSSADAHLLSGIITRATGMTAIRYAGKYLFEPLGIGTRQWFTDPQLNEYGGTGLFLNAREMALFGMLYLNEGYWEGQQIFSREWASQALDRQVLLRREVKEEDLPPVWYGYQWWVRDQGGHMAGMAVGFGGTYIVVVPDLDMVIVITSDINVAPLPDDMRGTNEVDFSFFEDYVIAALVNAQ